MSSETIFPDLEGWEATRDTLKWYSRGVGNLPRTHAEAHPKWWHISLKVEPDGMITDEMGLPEGGKLSLKMDLKEHAALLRVDGREVRRFSMTEGLTSTQFAERLMAAAADLGLEGDYVREKFENDDPREYDPAMAEKYLTALTSADRLFKQHRESLEGEVGPVQLWPHGFDLAFEWFGTRKVKYEEGGQITEYPSQLNLGFSPGDPTHPGPYFYSNPFPFEGEKLLDKELPQGANWFTTTWHGTLLPYGELVGDKRAGERLLEFARRVYEVCKPTLMA